MTPRSSVQGRLSFAALLFAVGCASGPIEYAAETPAAPAAFSFIVIGDTPYNAMDEAMLKEALPKAKVGNFPFVIHLGDTIRGGAECAAEIDDRHAALIAGLAPTPVFYTPGDNEWTDCDRSKDPATGKPYSELQRLKTIRERFFADAIPTPKSFEYERQHHQPENASWRYGGVRFATLHLVGAANGRILVQGDPLPEAAAAADARDKANLEWIEHVASLAEKEHAAALVFATQANLIEDAGKPACVGASDKYVSCDAQGGFRKALHATAVRFGKPVLVVHGDTPPFTLDQNFAESSAPNMWVLDAAGDFAVSDLTLVTIDAKEAPSFSARTFLGGRRASGPVVSEAECGDGGGLCLVGFPQ